MRFVDYVIESIYEGDFYHAHPYHWFAGCGCVYGDDFRIEVDKSLLGRPKVELLRKYEYYWHRIPVTKADAELIWAALPYAVSIQNKRQSVRDAENKNLVKKLEQYP